MHGHASLKCFTQTRKTNQFQWLVWSFCQWEILKKHPQHPVHWMLILYQSSGPSFPKSLGRDVMRAEESLAEELRWRDFELGSGKHSRETCRRRTACLYIYSKDNWETYHFQRFHSVWYLWKDLFFHDSTHEPFSHKPPQGLRIRNIEQVKGFATRIFLVKRRPSQTYQQNAWVRCWSCNLRYQITMRSDNMSAKAVEPLLYCHHFVIPEEMAASGVVETSQCCLALAFFRDTTGLWGMVLKQWSNFEACWRGVQMCAYVSEMKCCETVGNGKQIPTNNNFIQRVCTDF